MKKYSKYQEVYFKFVETSQQIEALIKKTLQPFSLTHGQYNILRILRGAGDQPLTAKMIRERMIVDNPDVTRLITRLKSKGFVAREINPQNRRQVDISISAKGLAQLVELDPVMKSVVGNFFEDYLQKDEASQLYLALNKIKSGLI